MHRRLSADRPMSDDTGDGFLGRPLLRDFGGVLSDLSDRIYLWRLLTNHCVSGDADVVVKREYGNDFGKRGEEKSVFITILYYEWRRDYYVCK